MTPDSAGPPMTPDSADSAWPPGTAGEAVPPGKTGLPARSRGLLALDPAACTSCMICARECPDWCIVIDAHTEPVPDEAGGAPGGRPARRQRTRTVLDAFTIDFSLCMYCGICVEACPYDALSWAPSYDYPGVTRAGLLHDLPRLDAARSQVVPQPALEAGADSESAARPARRRLG